MSREVVIVSAVRTPIGSFQGSLASVTAPNLGATAIKGALEQAGVAGADVDEVLMGCVLPAGVGQAPARQASKLAGVPDSVPCVTLNKVCGSGLKTVVMAAQAIKCGDAEIVVAGGMESMSNAPYLLPKARTGYRLGNGQLIDGLVHDGLWDPYNDFHMGNAGEICADGCNIDRARQDAYAAESYRRAQEAVKEGLFKPEIVPVSVPQRRGDPVVVSEDEEPFRGKIEKLPKLRSAFKKDGTITAGNASTINDGASAVVLMSREEALAYADELYEKLGLPDPKNFGQRYPHQVSGGQLQRAMTVMALCAKPDLIVFDEPTTALDVTTQIEVLATIKHAINETGTAALYITHDLAVVAQISDDIMVLRHGKTVEYGTTDEIINKPKEQ
ncbi:MAG: acetyl-CoA C-acyltransferase, partial [Nannocystaceae bacterium]